MDNKATIWKWSVLLLILCNMGLVLTIWLKPNFGGNPRPETPRDYVIRNLKFTDAQVKQYDELIKDHQNAMTPLKKESMEYRGLLFGNIKNAPDGMNADSLSQLIANNQKQVELVTYKHFVQVRAICNDAQKAEFDKIIMDIMKKMSGGMHGGPPPRRDGQGPPPDHDGPDHPHDGQEPPPDGPQNP